MGSRPLNSDLIKTYTIINMELTTIIRVIIFSLGL